MNDHESYSSIRAFAHTPLQQSVIDYIIAENEGLNPPENSVTDCMRAFEGGFSPDKPFTCYMPTVNKVLLYVAEERAGYGADKRSDFNKRWEKLKQPLVETAKFIEELERKEWIRILIRPHETGELPQNYGRHWRRYENFYMSEIESLIFACTTIIIPRLKLYKYWERTHTKEPEKKVRPIAVRV
jgi:hypothetical protein